MTFWNDQREAALREDVQAGLSASLIGTRLGCTKGTVIGKVRRMGLHLKGVRGGNMKTGKRRQRSQPNFSFAAQTGVTLLELNNTTCRWPIGEVGQPDFHFCGGPAELDAGRPYCDAHSALAYRP